MAGARNSADKEEYFSRVSLALTGCGKRVLWHLLQKRVRELTPKDHPNQPWSIDEFLNHNMTDILMSVGKDRRKKNILYPFKQDTDLTEWDIPIFALVLLNVCELDDNDSLHCQLKHDIFNLNDLRNKMQHKGTPTLDEPIYLRYFGRIVGAVQRICDYIQEPDLKESLLNELDKYGSLMHVYPNGLISELGCKPVDIINEADAAVANGLQQIEMLIQKKKLSVNIPVLDVMMMFRNYNKEDEGSITERLLRAFADALDHDDLGSSELDAEVKSLVCKLFNEKKEITKVSRGCLVLTIQCHTMDAVISLVQDSLSGKLEALFGPLEEVMRTYVDHALFEVCVGITRQSCWGLLNEMFCQVSDECGQRSYSLESTVQGGGIVVRIQRFLQSFREKEHLEKSFSSKEKQDIYKTIMNKLALNLQQPGMKMTVLSPKLQREHGSMIVSRNQAMTEVDVQSLVMCKEEIILHIDPFLVSATLCKDYPRFEPVHQSIQQLEMRNDRKYVSEVLLSSLPQNICLKDFVFVLKECGYIALAAELLRSRLKLDAPTTLKDLHRSTSGQRPSISKMNFNLKKMVDDAQFTNPRLFLRQTRDRLSLKIQNESDEDRRHILNDICIAFIGAEIDAIAITFDKGLNKATVFTEMKSLTNTSSNTLLTDGVYFGRLANANAIAGRFNESDNLIKAALCNAFHIGPCFELVFMIYNAVQVMLYCFEKSPTAEERRALLMWGRRGLECVEEANMDGKHMWRRSFVLRMVFCLLGIGNRANVIENCPVDDTCIVEANKLLADIEKNLTGIETRRKMLYYVAKARIAELTKQHHDCLDNLRASLNLARKGHFHELRFISDYLDKVNTQSQHPDHIKREEREREMLDNLILDTTKNYALLGSQSLETLSIRTIDDDETIPKLRLYSPVALSSTSTSAGNSDADSFAKPKCVFSSENPYPTEEQLHGSFETRIPSAGRETARLTPCQTGERLSDSHVDYQKEGNTSVEHLNVYKSFKNSSLDSDDLFGD